MCFCLHIPGEYGKQVCFASPVTVRTLVLLYSNPAGCTSGSLPAAVHTDVGVQLK